MDQQEKQQQVHTLKTSMSSLKICCTQQEMSLESIVFGAYCLLLHRKTNYPSFSLGYGSGTNIRSIQLQIDSSATAMDVIKAAWDAHSATGRLQNGASRSFLALFGTADSQAFLRKKLAPGHIAAVLLPGSSSLMDEPLSQTHKPPSMLYLYDESIFTGEEIHIHHLQFETLLTDILENPQKPVVDLNLMSAYERTLIQQVNDTDIPYSEDKSIHEYMEDVAARLPDAPALRFCGEELSYAVFNRRTNQLAQKLSAAGAGPGTFIAIAANRGFELILSMFAVLKTGAAYVPLSPLYPPEYLAQLVKHCGAPLLLTTSPETLEPLADNVRLLDLRSSCGEGEDSSNLARPAGFSSQSPAALIYTSGTTGRPKGVLVRHNTVVNYCEYNLREFHINNSDRIMQFAPFPFSTSILEISTTLMSGAKLCLVPDAAVVDPGSFYREMKTAEATILLAPPEYVSYIPLPSTLRVIETGASECRREISNKIIQSTRHVNAYGLTEGSVPTVWHGCEGPRPRRIPIGKPVANTRVYILDTNGKECGAYIPGELCVTGLAVSDGYWGEPALTAQRFIPNPFGEGIMLRTGDIAQWNANGDVEYIGRTDNQIQVRGMRVELEDVERSLSQIPMISGSAVVARPAPNGDTQIVAFITPAHGADNQPLALDPEEIRLELYNHLLEHKVPSIIVCLAKMPLTPNGKIDRHALTVLDITSADTTAPRDKAEELIAHVFSEILGISPISAKSHFFALGGHSLRAAQAANMLEKLSGIRLPLRQWFQTPTVAELAQVLREALASIHADSGTEATPQSSADFTAGALIPKAQTRNTSRYPMSPAQRRLYLACQSDNTGTAYNIPVALVFTGALDTEKAQTALTVLAQRHETLRTFFAVESPGPLQSYSTASFIQDVAPPDKSAVPLDIIPLHPHDTPQSLLAQFVHPFDLSRAPLLRACAAVSADGARSILLIDIHHIIADGTTMHLLLSEFNTLYNGHTLPDPPLQYRDFSQWLAARDLAAQKNHWLSVFARPIPVSDLITDFPRRRRSYQGGETETPVSTELRAGLEAFADTQGVTPFMIMLAALMILLAKYTRQEDIAIGSPVAGRLHRDLEHTAGMFVNTVVLRGYPLREKEFSSFLGEIRQICLLAFENQEYPFEELHEALNLPPDPTRNPLFDVMLTMQNNETFSPNLNGLDFLHTVQNPESAKFDLAFEVMAEESAYRIKLIYSTALFRPESAENMLRQYLTLLNAAVAAPSQTIGNLPLEDFPAIKEV